VEDLKHFDENPHSINSPGQTRGTSSLGSENAEALANSLEAQFQPVNDPSFPLDIEVINEAMRAYFLRPQLTLS